MTDSFTYETNFEPSDQILNLAEAVKTLMEASMEDESPRLEIDALIAAIGRIREANWPAPITGATG